MLAESEGHRVSEATVADVLQRVGAASPERDARLPTDLEGDFDFWFDGGAGRSQTGSVELQFADGTRAVVGVPLRSLHVVIDLPDHHRVLVQQLDGLRGPALARLLAFVATG